MLYDLGEKRPEWVPEVVAHRLRRRFAVIRAAGEDLHLIELIGYDDSAARMFAKSSTRAPAEFVEHVLPAVLDISDAALIDDQPPKYDAVWPILIKGDHPTAKEACLTGLAEALRDVIPELRRRDTHLANHLLLALYRGGAERYADRDLKLQVCRKAFAESRGHCGKSIADVLGSIEDPLPDDAVQMLHWLATEHEDPAKEAWREDAGNGQTYYNGDIHMNGINTTRGRAADALRDLILTDPAYIDRFGPTLDRMSRDQSAAVLSCLAGTLGAVAYHDRALSMRTFLGMNLYEDRLLATPHVCEFIRGGLRDSFPALLPIVERMLRSTEPEVREAGARLISIAALHHESAAYLVDKAVRGDPRQRLGVAKVAAANIANPECRAWCEAKLATLFNDCDADVRDRAASCFSYLENQDLDTYGTLITAFCDSRASAGSTFWLLHTLEDSLETLPGMTCKVCESILDRLAEARAVPNDGGFDDINTVAKLAFRTYQQHQNDDWTSRSLALIDRLCLEGIPGTGAEFEHFER